MSDWQKPSFSFAGTSTMISAMYQISTDAEELRYWPVKIVFPPTSLFPPAKIVWDDPTCHVTSFRAAPVENAEPDKWVCGDEQLMEWLAKVTMPGESPFCSLISIWNNTTFCKCLTTSAKGQPSGTRIHHLDQTLPFLLVRIEWKRVAFNLLVHTTLFEKKNCLPN